MLIIVPLLVLSALVLIIGVMWGRAYERSLWQRHMLQRSGLPDEPRLHQARDAMRASGGDSERLAQAVDAIAVEVERLGEGQRFLTRLIAEREARGAGTKSPPPGSVRAPLPPTT